MSAIIGRLGIAVAAALSVATCASPPLKLYNLGAISAPLAAAPLSNPILVIEVRRITMPDYLDTEDILVRHGSEFERSQSGRWASRLSLGITDLVTARLAARRPDALVTDRVQTYTPGYRLLINISELDVNSDGKAVIEADWEIVPGDVGKSSIRNRIRVTTDGPTSVDSDIVALNQKLTDHLADAIDVSTLR